MKKAFTGIVALLAGVFAAHSQGTVSFANYNTLNPYIYVSLTSRTGPDLGGNGGNTTGNPAADVGNGNDWSVALYGNAGLNDPASSLTECTAVSGGFATATFANGALANGVFDRTPGTWASSIVAQIPGTTGAYQPATLQLYAWYNDAGTITSFGDAVAIGYPAGTSALANLPDTGGAVSEGLPIQPPLLPSGLGSFAIGIAVPEANTLTLCVTGALAVLLSLRRRGNIGVRPEIG